MHHCFKAWCIANTHKMKSLALILQSNNAIILNIQKIKAKSWLSPAPCKDTLGASVLPPVPPRCGVLPAPTYNPNHTTQIQQSTTANASFLIFHPWIYPNFPQIVSVSHVSNLRYKLNCMQVHQWFQQLIRQKGDLGWFQTHSKAKGRTWRASMSSRTLLIWPLHQNAHKACQDMRWDNQILKCIPVPSTH